MIRHLGLGVVLGSIALGLSACGGGSSGATPPRTNVRSRAPDLVGSRRVVRRRDGSGHD